jgi:diguanylate cyclase (GGDEF)-like protein
MRECDICVIDDDKPTLMLLERLLVNRGFEVAIAERAVEGFELIRTRRPKLVISDWRMPDKDGFWLCGQVRANEALAGTYFVICSGVESHDGKMKALEAGADDYVMKPLGPRELEAHVRVGIRMWNLHAELRRAALTDGLTKLFNHDHFNEIIDQELQRSRRFGHPMSLLMLDLDFFKVINDTFGHLAGNNVLVEAAHLIRTSVRDIDTVSRFGGEEFAIIMPECRAKDAAIGAERIRQQIAENLQLDVLHGHRVTVSIGVADTEDPRVRKAADLLELADRAMYAAKTSGRNCVRNYLDSPTEMPENIELKSREIETLRKRIEVLSSQTRDAAVQSIASLMQALEEKDPYSSQHCQNVSFYSGRLASAMGYSDSIISAVTNAGLLHDIGKVGIPDRILMKPSALDTVERMVMHQVPMISVRILDHLRLLETEIQIIRHQREYFDGSGIPSGLKGDQIPIGSRILLVADAFDSMTTDRLYRSCAPVNVVVEEMCRCSGRQFDPEVVDVLDRILKEDGAEWRSRVEDSLSSMCPLPAGPSR